MARPPTDKRERIVDAAADRVHAEGFHTASLATIARQADVPVGSVYYFFRSKEDLGRAVIDRQDGIQRARQQDWDTLPNPIDRLVAFVERTRSERSLLAARGCPVGSLCGELQKGGGALGSHAGQVFAGILAWLTAQFRDLGRPDPADDAEQLLAAVQGAALLAHAAGDPDVVSRASDRLTAWIHTLASQETP